MEWGSFDWGYERGVAHPDYAIFHLVLPVILKQEDGTRFYQPSSPFSPDHDSPNRDDRGDQHPWSVGFQNTDFRDYRKMICRFPNEGGILGPTALPTVRACLEPGQEAIKSFAWEVHENSIACRGWADGMLTQWLGKSIRSMSIEDYVYYGGIVQGEGLAEYIRNFRRRMFSSASAVFWMYNDCWPMVRSWVIVDYYLRRTPSFHPVRRAFAPLTVALAVENDEVKVFGVNEGPDAEAELRYGLFALSGGYPLDEVKKVTLPANASTVLATFRQSDWLKLGEKTHAAFALLCQNGRIIARDRLFLPFFKEMVWPEPAVKVRRKAGRAVLESETFAWRVCLDLDGERPVPDNFFDLFPGEPYVLEWPDELGKPKVLRVGNLCG
jgi:beta-mannosidase